MQRDDVKSRNPGVQSFVLVLLNVICYINNTNVPFSPKTWISMNIFVPDIIETHDNAAINQTGER